MDSVMINGLKIWRESDIEYTLKLQMGKISQEYMSQGFVGWIYKKQVSNNRGI